MFGIGTTEIIVIFIVALLFLGPKRLPELARNLGRVFADFRRTANDLQSHLNVDAVTRYSPPPRPATQTPIEKPAESQPASAAQTQSDPTQKADDPSSTAPASSESSGT